MNRNLGLAGSAAAIALLVAAGAAFGGEGVAISITNDGTDDILVTVYDTTLGPNAVVLSHERINGFTTIPLSLAADATGRANVSWTAVTADPRGPRCGHAEQTGLGNSASVTVRAESPCTTATAGASAASFQE